MPIVFLPIIEAFIAHYGMALLFLLGNIGNTFVILIFYQRRKVACPIYLSSAAIMNIIYLTFDIPIFIYTYFYGEPIPHSLIFCKLRFYLSHIFSQMAIYFIVLACLDQYILTNLTLNLRNFSRSSVAKYLILSVAIFWCVIGSHQLVFTTMYNQRCGQFGIYYMITSIYLFISFSITPPVLMIIFGYLACHQIKLLGRQIRPLTNNLDPVIALPRDRKLLLMILVQVFIYFLISMFYLSMNLELLITFYTLKNKSIERIQIENFITIISIFLSHINYAAPFYIYILVSKTFRDDFKKLFRKYRQQRMTASVIESM